MDIENETNDSAEKAAKLNESIRIARKKISDARLISFLRDVRHEILATSLINDSLDEGESLDQIFLSTNGYGFRLSIDKETKTRYRIHFGCQVAPLAGDAGSWTVTFGDDDEVVSISAGPRMIS